MIDRRFEFATRAALGASSADIRSLVIRHWTAMAVVIGLGGAFAAARSLQGLLYGIPASDPLAFGAAVLLIATVAYFACYLPARRAARVDPMSVLRSS